MGRNRSQEDDTSDEHEPPDGLARSGDKNPSGQEELRHIGIETADLAVNKISPAQIRELIEILIEMIQDASITSRGARTILMELIDLIQIRHPGCFTRTNCLRLIEMVVCFEKKHGRND